MECPHVNENVIIKNPIISNEKETKEWFCTGEIFFLVIDLINSYIL